MRTLLLNGARTSRNRVVEQRVKRRSDCSKLCVGGVGEVLDGQCVGLKRDSRLEIRLMPDMLMLPLIEYVLVFCIGKVIIMNNSHSRMDILGRKTHNLAKMLQILSSHQRAEIP